MGLWSGLRLRRGNREWGMGGKGNLVLYTFTIGVFNSKYTYLFMIVSHFSLTNIFYKLFNIRVFSCFVLF